jgi:hypothetical protein
MASVGHLAEVATHRFHVGERPGVPEPCTLQESAFAWLGLPQDALDSLEPQLREELSKARSILEIA